MLEWGSYFSAVHHWNVLERVQVRERTRATTPEDRSRRLPSIRESFRKGAWRQLVERISAWISRESAAAFQTTGPYRSSSQNRACLHPQGSRLLQQFYILWKFDKSSCWWEFFFDRKILRANRVGGRVVKLFAKGLVWQFQVTNNGDSRFWIVMMSIDSKVFNCSVDKSVECRVWIVRKKFIMWWLLV